MLHLSHARSRTRALAVAGAMTACVAAVCGVIAGGAFAAAATTTKDASLLGPIPPFTDNVTGKPISIAQQAVEGVPYVTKGNCPAWVINDPLVFTFTSGNAVLYRPSAMGPQGGNAEGQAELWDIVGSALVDTGYGGHTHLWFGSNINPTGNLQQYFGETGSFQGSAADGTSITITANPGFAQSASGHQNGWGKVSVTCTGF